jgi:hypothetical protein
MPKQVVNDLDFKSGNDIPAVQIITPDSSSDVRNKKEDLMAKQIAEAIYNLWQKQLKLNTME